ncbi:hypothetical protein N7481_007089 [Penicillium waksmanii]|uniref:uncharacterized protein n=1 Tax=Penicillium waksmanii TaxID=69791 RepID=UPI002547A97C|nr:uncharacterized protein N7481_007089 [Penicillium waksmanii]KAJ5979791.1 hypothetical protein N7481_007089 [Penicillium waksmanii]
MGEAGAHHWAEGIVGELMTNDHGRLEAFDATAKNAVSELHISAKSADSLGEAARRGQTQ